MTLYTHFLVLNISCGMCDIVHAYSLNIPLSPGIVNVWRPKAVWMAQGDSENLILN